MTLTHRYCPWCSLSPEDDSPLLRCYQCKAPAHEDWLYCPYCQAPQDTRHHAPVMQWGAALADVGLPQRCEATRTPASSPRISREEAEQYSATHEDLPAVPSPVPSTLSTSSLDLPHDLLPSSPCRAYDLRVVPAAPNRNDSPSGVRIRFPVEMAGHLATLAERAGLTPSHMIRAYLYAGATTAPIPSPHLIPTGRSASRDHRAYEHVGALCDRGLLDAFQARCCATGAAQAAMLRGMLLVSMQAEPSHSSPHPSPHDQSTHKTANGVHSTPRPAREVS